MPQLSTSKYSPLEAHLKKQQQDTVSMSFDEIERIIGDRLPPAAFKHRPWWSNNPNNSTITAAWLNAGFKTEKVDMKGRRLVFRRIAGDKPERASPRGASPGSPEIPRSPAGALHHPLFGALKGTIRVTPGTTLTEPADPNWGSQ